MSDNPGIARFDCYIILDGVSAAYIIIGPAMAGLAGPEITPLLIAYDLRTTC